MKRCIFTLLILFQSAFAFAKTEYLHVDHYPGTWWGMFAVFNYVAGVLYHYDQAPDSYAGLEVNFEHYGLYYDSAKGANWWQYFCEPIQLGSRDNAQIHRFPIHEFDHYAYFTERQLTRHQVFAIIQKYIKIKPEIQEKIDDFAEENFKGTYLISIHYRGTDKAREAPRVPYERVAEVVREHIKENKLKNYKIFAASDEQAFIDYFERQFRGEVVVYGALRSKDGGALHYGRYSGCYKHAEEAFIESVLLSKGDVLIRTSSNLSLWSGYFNPLMPIIELSKRN